MRKEIGLIFIAFLFVRIVHAEVPDSLVHFDELVFDRVEEKDAFYQLYIEKTDNFGILASLLNANTSVKEAKDVQLNINSFIEKYDNPDFQKLKPIKKVKRIHQAIHNNYLKKYQNGAEFIKLFQDGTYNCVTASALFSLVLRGLDIPYIIKLTPDYMYLLTYPETDVIMLETTNPYKGYLVMDQEYKKEYVNFLLELKVISQDEYDDQPNDSLFSRYYFQEEDIDLNQLMAVLYSNMSVQNLVDEKLAQAYDDICKAVYIHPLERYQHLLFFLSSALTYQSDFDDLSNVRYLYQTSRFTFSDMIVDVVSNAFYSATYKILIERGDIASYDQLYDILQEKIEDSTILSKITFQYNYERGRVLYNKMKYPEAVENIEKSLEIMPGHTEVQTLYIATFSHLLNDLTSTEEILEQIDRRLNKFPDLEGNSLVIQTRCQAILLGANHNFLMGNIPEGLQYLNRFESNFDPTMKDGDKLNHYIVKTYSTVSSYYFRNGNYREAGKYLDKGLEYVPGNFELEYKKKALK